MFTRAAWWWSQKQNPVPLAPCPGLLPSHHAIDSIKRENSVGVLAVEADSFFKCLCLTVRKITLAPISILLPISFQHTMAS